MGKSARVLYVGLLSWARGTQVSLTFYSFCSYCTAHVRSSYARQHHRPFLFVLFSVLLSQAGDDSGRSSGEDREGSGEDEGNFDEVQLKGRPKQEMTQEDEDFLNVRVFSPNLLFSSLYRSRSPGRHSDRPSGQPS